MVTLPFDHQSVKAAGVSRRASKSTRRSRARRSRSLSNLDLPIPVNKPFAQNTVAVLDRITLNLVRHLPIGVGRRLLQAAVDARRSLDLPQPIIQLRGWPSDPQVGDALKILLGRLSELEAVMGDGRGELK